jgi:hypothetical protein
VRAHFQTLRSPHRNWIVIAVAGFKTRCGPICVISASSARPPRCPATYFMRHAAIEYRQLKFLTDIGRSFQVILRSGLNFSLGSVPHQRAERGHLPG